MSLCPAKIARNISDMYYYGGMYRGKLKINRENLHLNLCKKAPDKLLDEIIKSSAYGGNYKQQFYSSWVKDLIKDDVNYGTKEELCKITKKCLFRNKSFQKFMTVSKTKDDIVEEIMGELKLIISNNGYNYEVQCEDHGNYYIKEIDIYW